MKSRITILCGICLGVLIQIYPVVAFDYATYQGEYFESDNFKYALYDDNTVFISRYMGKLETASSFEIPSQLDGYTVTGFDQGMFASYLGDEIDTLYVPATISDIHLCSAGYVSIDYINVDDNNPYYIGDRGIVYSHDYTELVWCPNNIGYYRYNVEEGCEKIDDYAFYGVSDLIELTLPESLKSIGAYAFYETSLPNIRIPALVENINNAGFPEEIDSIIVSKNNEYYYDIDGVLFDRKNDALLVYPSDKFGDSYRVPDGTKSISKFAFRSCNRLEKLNVSAGVKKIESYAVNNMKMLETVEFQDGLELIEGSAFTNLPHLSYIYIPKSVTTMEDAFDASLGMEYFDVDSENPKYESIDGVLFDYETKTLLEYPIQKSDVTEYSIPKGTVHIADSAIGYNEFLEKVTVPDTVKSIGDCGINFCKYLEEVILPPSLESIGISPDGMENVTFIVQEGCYADQWATENSLKRLYAEA